METGNLFAGIPDKIPDELVETLTVAEGKVRIERIVSRGHASPDDFWYDQESAEWVVLLTGEAVVLFEADSERKEMRPGDWVQIPPRCRHRVEATAEGVDSIWLAVHWD